MNQLIKSSFFRRQLFAFTFLVLAVIGAFIVFLIFATQISMENQQLEHVERYRERIAASLYDWLDSSRENLRIQSEYISALSEDFISSPALSELFSDVVESETSFIDLLIVDRQGKLINSRAWLGDREIFLKDRDYYTEGLRGKTSISGFYTSKSQGVPIMALGIPVFYQGRVAYILAGIITLEKVSSIITSLNIQNFGRAYLVNDQNEIITSKEYIASFESSPEKKEETENVPIRANQAMNDMIAGNSGTAMYTCPVHGEVFGSYRWIPELKVGLVIEFQRDVVMRPLRELIMYATLIGVAALLLSIAVTLFFSRRFLKPIHTLIDGTKNIISGASYNQITVRTDTELDLLIGYFNKMAETIKKRENDLTSLAMTDSLTGLFNHRLLIDFLEKEYSRNLRLRAGLTFVMIDIDRFKRINDTYGHQTGDEILKQLSHLLQRHLREGDLLGRYGGEEFGIVLPSNTHTDPFGFCERIRKSVEEHAFRIGEKEFSITISLGYCFAEKLEDTSPFDMIRIADEHLYTSKREGRNRTSGIRM